jgi:hypothetical protein
VGVYSKPTNGTQIIEPLRGQRKAILAASYQGLRRRAKNRLNNLSNCLGNMELSVGFGGGATGFYGGRCT